MNHSFPEQDAEGSPSLDKIAKLHEPVLSAEVIDFLQPGVGKLFLDGTLGFGGHSEALLRAGASVIGVDQDEDALNLARHRLATFGELFRSIHCNSREFPKHLEIPGPPAFDGMLFDLGVSSWQLDKPERGFSFKHEGPLDMRMNQQQERTAATVVNEWPEEELARALWEYGEERGSRRIARKIVERREVRPFISTRDLAEVIASCVPRHGKIHPATRSFQGLRIAINAELDSLTEILQHTNHWLKPGGRLAIISFHSLEDRIVKQFLRRHSQPEVDDPTWEKQRPNAHYFFDLPIKKAIKASALEIGHNPRSRSARLRLAIKRNKP